MKKIALLVLCSILILSFATGCGQNQTQNNTNQEQVETAMELKYTTSFELKYLEDGSKLVTDGAGRNLL